MSQNPVVHSSSDPHLSGPITVIKCGGNQAVDAEGVCADIAVLGRNGHRIVLVHGGSAEIGRLADALGVPQRRMLSPDGVSARYTDAATLDVVVLALAGAVKPRLVTQLAAHGVAAVGLTGLDGGLLRARRKSAHRAVIDGRTVVVRDDHSGRITSVRADLPHALLAAGFVPVVSPPALDEHDQPVNVDADRAAAALAAALGAERLVLLTGAPGVLADPDDENSVLTHLDVPPVGAPGSFAKGGMALKLIAAREALLGGVPTVTIADGRTSGPVSRALAGAGTQIVTAAAAALDPALAG